MSRGGIEGPAATVMAMPLAMCALDVAGQIRERSPADLAIFGEQSTRLIERFADRATGQALLARAVTDGSAEGDDLLVTAAGPRRFRVGLWRQRGGERIRVLAVFAPAGVAAGEASGLSAPPRRAFVRAGSDLRSPLAAIMGFAEMIRADPVRRDPEMAAAHASDILAAAWRLMRIAADLEAASSSGGVLPAMRPAEVDIARLARRVARLAAPAARSAGVTVDTDGLPGPGGGPLVLADEGALWSAIDLLLQGAVRHGGRRARIAVALDHRDGGAALTITAEGPGLKPETPAQLLEDGGGIEADACRELLLANGAALEIEAGSGFTARLLFPAARCLGPV